MKFYFALLLFLSSFTTHAKDIFSLDRELALNKVPVGTTINIKIPDEIIENKLFFVGGEMYKTNLYFEQGNLQVLEDKYETGNDGFLYVIPSKKASSNDSLCKISLTQYMSPKLSVNGDTLTLRVLDSARNGYRPSFNGNPSYAVLDTSVEKGLKSASANVSCDSGFLKGIFVGLNVGQFIDTFGKYLEGAGKSKVLVKSPGIATDDSTYNEKGDNLGHNENPVRTNSRTVPR